MRHSVSLSVLVILMTVVASVHAKDTGYLAPLHAEGATTINVDEAKWMFDEGAIFIDVRNPRFFARRHVPGAHHLDMKDGFTKDSLASVAKKDQPIVIYSSGVKCGRAYRAAELAVSWGYEMVYYFRGGIVDWKDVHYPIESSLK